MSNADKREAQRAARKQKILNNKDSRMTTVKGEYNEHRINDSDDEALSKLLSDENVSSQCVVIETASKSSRACIFVLLAVASVLFEHTYLTQVALLTPFVCTQLGVLSYRHYKGLLFKQSSSFPLLGRLLTLVGNSPDRSLKTAKFAIFIYNLIIDFVVFYFSYQIIQHYFVS